MTANVLNLFDPLAIPPLMVPSFRTSYAVQLGVEKNILLKTWGGIGDQICSEPTLRFALDTFKGCSVSLASELPDLFRHLPFKKIYDLTTAPPKWDEYFPFDMIVNADHLQWEFMSHMLINAVDYPSLCAFRCMLPVSYKPIRLLPSEENFWQVLDKVRGVMLWNCVAIHAGKHWQSKTFPAEWWNAVIASVIAEGRTPVLVGGAADDNRTTVDVDTDGCVDLRGKLSLMESVALLQSVPVLLTNDSSPLHMAASGAAWIGFVATCKHPDYISHWRRDEAGKLQWSWRMENHGRGGIWDVLDYCPNKTQKIEAENVGDELLRSWLPEPGAFGRWGASKCEGLGPQLPHLEGGGA